MTGGVLSAAAKIRAVARLRACRTSRPGRNDGSSSASRTWGERWPRHSPRTWTRWPPAGARGGASSVPGTSPPWQTRCRTVSSTPTAGSPPTPLPPDWPVAPSPGEPPRSPGPMFIGSLAPRLMASRPWSVVGLWACSGARHLRDEAPNGNYQG
jgi:hypothetical protein